MGFFQQCFPYYIINRYFPGRKESSFRRGIIFRFFCPSCQKHYNEKIQAINAKQLRGIPLRRKCAYCNGHLNIDNVFEDKRSVRKK